MIRKLLLPALAAAMLGACATPYDYRAGHGDYYYGQPSVDYYDYGYPGAWSGMMGFGYGYGGYGYGGYGYGYPYYGYGYPYYPPVIIVRPDPPRPGMGPHRPGMPTPGSPGQSPPSGPHGRGHPWLPSPVSPLADDRDPIRAPRIDPPSFPRDRIQREPRQPMLHEVRELPRPDRDDGLKPHH